MEISDTTNRLIEGYLKMLENLSPDNKLDLISKLVLSTKADISNKKKSVYNSFGAWESKLSAEEIIEEIQDSRK